MSVKMSIHQALATLKVLDNRILSASNQKFIAIKKGESQTIEGVKLSEVETELKGNLTKVSQLISNRKNLRAAIVASNAAAKVVISGKEMIVADAIERKANIHQEELLLSNMKKQYNTVKTTIDNDERTELPKKLEGYLLSVLGNSGDRKPEDVKQHSEDFTKKTALKMVDPNKIAEVIERFETELLNFKNEVDFKLSESNATTFIDVEYTAI